MLLTFGDMGGSGIGAAAGGQPRGGVAREGGPPARIGAFFRLAPFSRYPIKVRHWAGFAKYRVISSLYTLAASF